MMTKDLHIELLASTIYLNYDCSAEFAKNLAELLYNNGYRKLVEGNWIPTGDFHNDYYKCSNCDAHVHHDLRRSIKFCVNCGAHMKESD